MEDKVAYIKVDDLIRCIDESEEFSIIGFFLKTVIEAFPKIYLPESVCEEFSEKNNVEVIKMRLWHYKLFPYLPDAQFKGQLRELVAIMHDVRDRGATNHILINRVMEYPRSDLYGYFLEYALEYKKRYKELPKQTDEFRDFGGHSWTHYPFGDWHNTEYLRVCMANLYEKHHFGIGKSRINDEEWQRLVDGYRVITGEEYKI